MILEINEYQKYIHMFITISRILFIESSIWVTKARDFLWNIKTINSKRFADPFLIFYNKWTIFLMYLWDLGGSHTMFYSITHEHEHVTCKWFHTYK